MRSTLVLLVSKQQINSPLSACLSSVESSDFHESDDAEQVPIPFDVDIDFATEQSDLTSPGTAVGAGQCVNIPSGTSGSTITLDFDLANDQTIGINEVRDGGALLE